MPLLTERVRTFNRIMTERVGVLNDHFLGLNHPIGEARLLWEIGKEGASISELQSRLGLDSTCLSRELLSLEKQSLIIIGRTSKNGVSDRLIRLTDEGLLERQELDNRAEAFARSLLEPLSDKQREKLVVAMAQVEQLLTASIVQIKVADPSSQDARFCFEQYFAELGKRFDSGFDPAFSISARANELTPPAGLLLVAHLREEPIGCGALKFHHESKIGELKRMWVTPRARGIGLGRRILLALENSAREAGMTMLHLETNRSLKEAIELYRGSGYQEVEPFNDEPYAHHWFEKRL